MLIAGQRHLERVLRDYAIRYNEQRPHRGIQLEVPGGSAGALVPNLAVQRRAKGRDDRPGEPRHPAKPVQVRDVRSTKARTIVPANPPVGSHRSSHRSSVVARSTKVGTIVPANPPT